ncbi:trichohyalin-like isoform X2 [Rhinatrema bivittatum]|uniref:trichohyalin-like isoform X2 n=1 Tax=Rhinatrema bivittatum TaxID=194408 RepID=UPI00112B288E|nr:trichohyalin-like isoform X2 [Rhinatrema bivittatum]
MAFHITSSQLYPGKERKASRLTEEVIRENMATRFEQRSKKIQLEDDGKDLRVKSENQVTRQDEETRLKTSTSKRGSTKAFDQLSKEILHEEDERKNEKIKKPVSVTVEHLMKQNMEEHHRKQKATQQLREINNGGREKENFTTDRKEREQPAEAESGKGAKLGNSKERVINGNTDTHENDLCCVKNNLNIKGPKDCGKKSEMKGIKVERENESLEEEKYCAKGEASLKIENKSNSSDGKRQCKKGEKTSDKEREKFEKKHQKKETKDERRKQNQNEKKLAEKAERREKKDKEERKKHKSVEKTQGMNKMNVVEDEHERKGETKEKGAMEVEGRRENENMVGDQLMDTTEIANERAKRKELELNCRMSEKAVVDKRKTKEEKHNRKEKIQENIEGKIQTGNQLTDKERFGGERGEGEQKLERIEKKQVEEKIICRNIEAKGVKEENETVQKKQITNKENLEGKGRINEQDKDLEKADTENTEREQVTDKREKLRWKEKTEGKEYKEMEAGENREVYEEKNVKKETVDGPGQAKEKDRKHKSVLEEILANEKGEKDLQTETIQVKDKVEEEKSKKKQRVDMANKQNSDDEKYKSKGKVTETRDDKEKKIRRQEKDKKTHRTVKLQRNCGKRETHENERKVKEIWIEANMGLTEQLEVKGEKKDQAEMGETEGRERDKLLDGNRNDVGMLSAEEEDNEKEMEEVDEVGGKSKRENGNAFEEGRLNGDVDKEMEKNAKREKMEMEDEEERKEKGTEKS